MWHARFSLPPLCPIYGDSLSIIHMYPYTYTYQSHGKKMPIKLQQLVNRRWSHTEVIIIVIAMWNYSTGIFSSRACDTGPSTTGGITFFSKILFCVRGEPDFSTLSAHILSTRCPLTLLAPWGTHMTVMEQLLDIQQTRFSSCHMVIRRRRNRNRQDTRANNVIARWKAPPTTVSFFFFLLTYKLKPESRTASTANPSLSIGVTKHVPINWISSLWYRVNRRAGIAKFHVSKLLHLQIQV